jgi:hypothetical protein
MFFIWVLLAVVAVESLTELLTKSLFFSDFREYLKGRSQFTKDLISCGYCTSVWAAGPFALLLSISQSLMPQLLSFFVLWLFLHRAANYLHNINDKYFDKFYSK